MQRNNGSYLDTDSVIIVINKLKMYISEEEKNILNMKKILNNLSYYYSGYSDKILNSKINSLCTALNVMINNKKNYILYLNNIINKYVEMDQNNFRLYSKLHNDIN